MGAKVSVRNEMPYTWYYATQSSGYRHLGPGCSTSYDEQRVVHRWIYLRYENHNEYSFKFEFNTHKGDTTFLLRETGDRSQISLHCTSEKITQYCPNYGKVEEDNQRQKLQQQQEEQRRRQQEERRRQEEHQRQEEERQRQERLERERRIQEQLDRESQLSTLRLSQATGRLVEKQRLEGRAHHEECTQVLHQLIEDDAAAIERDEVPETEKRFEDLLLEFQISEDEGLRGCGLADRIKTLQNELAVRYCRENQLSIWSQFTFDQAVGYSELSLTEKMNVLQASLHVTLNGVRDPEEDQPAGWERKYDFLFGLVEELYGTNPSLAEDVLLNILDSVSRSVKDARKNNNNNGTFNADHIPPLDSVNQALTVLENSKPDVVKELQNKNPALYSMITSKKDDQRGSNLVAMEVLIEDHKRTLTTGSGNHVQKSRKILRDTMMSGDGELLLKRCMILHHPISSQNLSAALGDPVKPHHNRLSEDGVRDYYRVGYSNLVEEYSSRGVIDQNQEDRLKDWVNQNRHEDTDSAEYQEILQQLQRNDV